MANPEHVKIVLQRAAAIAAWRKAHPGERLDLDGADLAGVNLDGAHLQGVNLQAASLDGAHLQASYLQGADLHGAFLSNADLTGAHINRETNFHGVSVSGNTKGLGPWIFNPEKYILREIEFPPEYKQAGIGVMNYFAEVMEQKYPDIPVNVQIAQEGTLVRMTLETDDGHREVVERTLEEYGLVVAGKQAAATLLPDPMDILRLENQLAIVNTQLDNERRILQVTQANYEKRFKELMSEVTHLREPVSGQQRHADRLVDVLELQAFSPLRTLLDRGLTEDDEAEVKRMLTEVGQQNPRLFQRLAEGLTTGAIGGAIGDISANLLMPWSQEVTNQLSIVIRLAP